MLRLGQWLERALRREGRYLEQRPSMFGRARIYDVAETDGLTMRVLDIEGTWQSALYLECGADQLAFAYHRHFAEVLTARGLTSARTLMLGGGGFAFPSWLVAHDAAAEVVAVEIDPTIIELAERWLAPAYLAEEERARLSIVCGDALHHLRTQAAKEASFGVIINDLFAASRPEQALMEPEGIALVKQALEPGGLYMANVISALRGSRSRPLSRVLSALEASFAHTAVIPLGADSPCTPDNNVVIASDVALD